MKNWQEKRVLVIGAARQGLALSRFLASKGAQVIVNDQRPDDQLQDEKAALRGFKVEWHAGGHPLHLLEGVDVVFVSGGVPLDLPLLVEAVRRGIPLSNDSQLFMEQVSAPVIGITGSAGKTTTTALVGRMAQADVQPPQQAWVGGNIGNPLIEDLEKIQPHDRVVLELSSFQLELMSNSPQVAAVLNITPNHLDRHKTMEAYTAAKAHIIDFQRSGDVAILNREDSGSWGLRHRIKGKLVTFGFERPSPELDGTYLEEGLIWWQHNGERSALFPASEILLRGEHNRLNVLAACAIALAAGFSVESIRAGVSGFRGVAHRLEYVRTWRGVQWYNDSIATAPERVRAALRAFSEPLVLLLGGRDKHLPWEELAADIRQRVDHVVLFGEAAGKIQQAIGRPAPGERPITITRCERLEEAVLAAAQVAEAGDVVLLSPGCTSFDAFKDFEERGEAYRLWVNQLS
ncbi:UDP-N-acetylmuramoylalanine--D-glutamate ligase [Bellilinea caldifistulae]|uniref:UDP-N-acetylmuramoyl-L-alanine--D-glutamate ligase n=1 Tax=Bellilinea caldifistulae TaxID=360411 RepID=UPI000785D92C|nr:UDP-N-acetylmuramoyl-L-alanine--D-glutamate ligase [Bellilinea caldifistulae]GAP11382.1 UDP-N-acetylmuramoylalanine--D-glutamate ligase [Bellilinea caldifistulae]